MMPRGAMVPARRKSTPEKALASVGNGRSASGKASNGVVKATEAPAHEKLGLSPDRLREMFRMMLLARAVDERQWILNRSGREAFHISCQGHEGSGVGS